MRNSFVMQPSAIMVCSRECQQRNTILEGNTGPAMDPPRIACIRPNRSRNHLERAAIAAQPDEERF